FVITNNLLRNFLWKVVFTLQILVQRSSGLLCKTLHSFHLNIPYTSQENNYFIFTFSFQFLNSFG
ncbi:hypothetical protein L9F63_004668, partial [Diploptera punctata]